MTAIFNFYMDDSGARQPDRAPGRIPSHGRDWFALGGVIVEDGADETRTREMHSKFASKWGLKGPLHSYDIRNCRGHFDWLHGVDPGAREAFLEELSALLVSAPVLGLACVIDRPGYNHRYQERYAERRWLLCKTAFCVAVERAAKYARSMGGKLRVFPERCNKTEDGHLLSYYRELKTGGMPFASETSGKYAPLTSEQLKETLYDFKVKHKSSPLVQLADLYLWPICIGGYHRNNRAYQRLLRDGKLIECVLPQDEHAALGTKYSCFDLVDKFG